MEQVVYVLLADVRTYVNTFVNAYVEVQVECGLIVASEVNVG